MEVRGPPSAAGLAAEGCARASEQEHEEEAPATGALSPPAPAPPRPPTLARAGQASRLHAADRKHPDRRVARVCRPALRPRGAGASFPTPPSYHSNSSPPTRHTTKTKQQAEPNDEGPPGPTIDDYEVVNDEELQPQDEYIARAGENRDEAADDDEDDEAPPGDDEEDEGEDLLGDGFLK